MSTFRKNLVALALGCAIAFAIMWTVGQITSNHARSDHALVRSDHALALAQRNQLASLTAEQAAAAARQAQTAAQAAHQAFLNAVLADCQDTNKRHDAAIRQLHVEVTTYARRIHRPALLRQLRESEASSALLIDAAIPKRNCQQVVASATRP